MARVIVPPVPGDEGGWFDLNGISGLTSDHQEQYLDLADELRQAKRDLLAANPVNPAVMPDPDDDTPVRLTRKDLAPVRELVEGWMVADSSFGVPLPRPLPLVASNVLREALEPVFSALNGDVPKPPGLTSGATSADDAGALPQEPEPAL
jgi:hypothetical protein